MTSIQKTRRQWKLSTFEEGRENRGSGFRAFARETVMMGQWDNREGSGDQVGYIRYAISGNGSTAILIKLIIG